jgi:hypothetical protein
LSNHPSFWTFARQMMSASPKDCDAGETSKRSVAGCL